MTPPVFEVEKITDAEIEILHLVEGHRYNILFAGKRKRSSDFKRRDPGAGVDAPAFAR